jgi:hypothetical protein
MDSGLRRVAGFPISGADNSGICYQLCDIVSLQSAASCVAVCPPVTVRTASDMVMTRNEDQ